MIRSYTAEDFRTFLKALDRVLDRKAEIIVIGGAAALLAFKATQLTQDIDTFNNVNAIQDACEKARQNSGLAIPLTQASVADAPYYFEDRLRKYTGIKFQNLLIKIPEIHDWILMKTIRGYEHDLEMIEETTRKNKVSKTALIKRFDSEMGHVIGERRRLRINFASVLARCFDDETAEKWARTNFN